MAAAVKIEEKLKDITDCPICLETVKEPRILPCIHTFCMQCLQKTGEKLSKNPGDMMPCPVCRKEFTVPETGFGGLQKNFFMDKLTEIKNILQPSSALNLCDACREDNESLAEADIPSAEMYCIECHQRLCSECYKHHSKNKLTKSHKLVATDGQHDFESKDMQELSKTVSCELHLNCLLEIYCSSCLEVVCAICFIENHQRHVGSDINKVAKDIREELQMNVDEFSSFLPHLREAEKKLDKYKAHLMRCTKYIHTKVNKRRHELKTLVDKDADSLRLELDSVTQQNLKECELRKEDIDTLLVCFESLKAYCLKLTAVGSASDMCRAKSALDIRIKELKQLYTSAAKSSYQLPRVSFKIRTTNLLDCVGSPDQNRIGTLEDQTEDVSFKRSSNARSDNLRNEYLDTENPTASMLETIKTLNEELEIERAYLRKLKQERTMLAKRSIELESNEQMLSKMVEDLKCQVVLLNDLVHGSKEQETGRKGNVAWGAGFKSSATVENCSAPKCDTYRILGIAILENELYILDNSNIAIIHDLSTMRFKRRWKMPSDGDVDDLKQCDTNKCLYIMQVSSTGNNEILRVDPYGKVITSWSVDEARGQLSVTQEYNVLLTVSKENQLQEYAPDGRLVQTVQLSWDSGIEYPQHAIKLTSEHFLICHGQKDDVLCRVCIVDKTGDVLHYTHDVSLWKRFNLNNPIYLAIVGQGDILVVDCCNRRVSLLSSDLKFKLDLCNRTLCHPRKICVDEANGRLFIVENVWSRSRDGNIQKGDHVVYLYNKSEDSERILPVVSATHYPYPLQPACDKRRGSPPHWLPPTI